MWVPLKLWGRSTYMLKVEMVCCSPPVRSLMRMGWRMSLMPTLLMGMWRVSALDWTSSMEVTFPLVAVAWDGGFIAASSWDAFGDSARIWGQRPAGTSLNLSELLGYCRGGDAVHRGY